MFIVGLVAMHLQRQEFLTKQLALGSQPNAASESCCCTCCTGMVTYNSILNHLVNIIHLYGPLVKFSGACPAHMVKWQKYWIKMLQLFQSTLCKQVFIQLPSSNKPIKTIVLLNTVVTSNKRTPKKGIFPYLTLMAKMSNKGILNNIIFPPNFVAFCC